MSESENVDVPEPVFDSNASIEDDSVELSLDELGRAYAKAVGLVPEPAKPESIEDADLEERDEESICPISPKSILEAILFVGTPDDEDKLTTRKIASWLRDVSPKEITEAAKQLNAEYEAEGAVFRIQRDKSTLRLVLSDEYESIRERFYGEVRKARLSQQAIDVLAIVAYNQPVSRGQVEKLRGRSCGAILSQLTKRQLLSIEASKESPKTKEFRTTDRFLEMFGLDTLDDLPQSDETQLQDLTDK